jgi:hypothetical protein
MRKREEATGGRIVDRSRFDIERYIPGLKSRRSVPLIDMYVDGQPEFITITITTEAPMFFSSTERRMGLIAGGH